MDLQKLYRPSEAQKGAEKDHHKSPPSKVPFFL